MLETLMLSNQETSIFFTWFGTGAHIFPPLNWVDLPWATSILDGLLAPFYYPLEPARRLFLGFILSSLLLGFIAYWRQNTVRQYHIQDNTQHSKQYNTLPRTFFSWQAWRHYLGSVFDRKLWRHPSTLLDFKILIANSAFRAAVITPTLLSRLVVIVAVSAFLRDTLHLPQFTPNHTLLIIGFSIVLFIAEDGSRYWQHKLMHRHPVLWALHKVHHSAEHLTPFTLYRQHPLEIVISSLRQVLVIGTVTGIFVALFPGQITFLEILGVDLLGFLFNLAGANLRHSHLRLSFGPLNRWFISPEMHQVHHSNLPIHRNKNYGSCLAIWDRLGGTLHVPAITEKMVFGCHRGGKHSLTSQWGLPLLTIMEHTKRWAPIRRIKIGMTRVKEAHE